MMKVLTQAQRLELGVAIGELPASEQIGIAYLSLAIMFDTGGCESADGAIVKFERLMASARAFIDAYDDYNGR